MKFLKLNFSDAKWFPTNKGSKDYIFDVITKKKHQRKYCPRFKELITFYHISNMLHVLFMERPKPSLKTCLYERMGKYDDMANNSLIAIDTPTAFTKKGDVLYPKEKINLKKAAFNSWNPEAEALPVTWEQVRKFFFYKEEKGKVYFDEFIKFLESEGFDVNKQFETLVDDIRSSDEATNDRVYEWTTGNQCTALANYLSSVTWSQVREFFAKKAKDEDYFNDFIELLKDEGFNVDQNFRDLADNIRMSGVIDNKNFQWLNDKDGKYKKYKPLGDYLQRDVGLNNSSWTIKNPLIQSKTSSDKLDSSVTVLGGPGDVVKLSGTIFVPVDDEDIEKLRKSKGTATILDGGIVMIEGIYYEDDIEWDDYMPDLKQVSELSVEQVK